MHLDYCIEDYFEDLSEEDALRLIVKSEKALNLLVELDESQRIGLRFFGMYADLKEMLGREVDLVADGCLLPFAEKSANRDKILIYLKGMLM